MNEKENGINVLADYLWREHDEIPRDDCRAVAEQVYKMGYRKQKRGAWDVWEAERISAAGYRNYRYCICNLCAYRSAVATKYCPGCGAYMKGKEDESKNQTP